MRATSFLGPDREPNAYPLTDAAEVRAARRILFQTAPGAEPDWLTVEELLGPEQYDSHEEYMVAHDRELWGDVPFEED